MRQPGRRKIKIFLDVFNKLDQFEATQRYIRGNNPLIEGQLPVPEVVEVVSWLKDLANPNLPRAADHQ